MVVKGFGCIVNIMFMIVKMFVVGLDLFSGVCVGLIVFLVGIVCIVVDKNVIINNILFGYFVID